MLSISPAIRRPCLFRPRFSLRTLLVGFTLFAVGFSVWHQWSWVTTEWKYRECPCTGRRIAPGEPPIGRITYMWKRRGLAWRLHGPWREYDRDGKLWLEKFYRYGELHGPYRKYSNYESVEGTYAHDQRVGVWTYRSNGGTVEWRTTMQQGLMQESTLVVNGEVLRKLTFNEARLVAIDGKPAQLPLKAFREGGDPADEQWNAELERSTTFEFFETPLGDAFEFLGNQHSVHFMIEANVDRDLAVTEYCRGLRLHEGLAVLCQPRGLVCQYRDGALWITTANEDVEVF